MIAKMLLPRVGGAPSTWTTCVLFFQAVLLAGYVYAHWVGRRRARTQLAIHAVLLLLPLGMLPFSIVTGAPGTGPIAPTLWLLRALALAIGPPFFVLAAGAPLLQKWLAGSRLPGSGDPYVLYAASNAGSLLGLAAYPILIEPALGLARQAAYWAGGYALYVVLALACAVRAVARAGIDRAGRPSGRRRAEAARPPMVAMDRARGRALQPDARRDVAPHRRRRGPALSLGPSPRPLPAQLRDRVRAGGGAVPSMGTTTFRSPPSSSCCSG